MKNCKVALIQPLTSYRRPQLQCCFNRMPFNIGNIEFRRGGQNVTSVLFCLTNVPLCFDTVRKITTILKFASIKIQLLSRRLSDLDLPPQSAGGGAGAGAGLAQGAGAPPEHPE